MLKHRTRTILHQTPPIRHKPTSKAPPAAKVPRKARARTRRLPSRTRQVASRRSRRKIHQAPSSPHSAQAIEAIQNVSSSLGGLAGALKIIFYAIVALLLGFVVWKYRQQILQALADILRELRALFCGRTADGVVDEKTASSSQPRRSSFNDFRDPFSTGQHSRMAPEELVCYTFAAFEAWANDRGRTRTPGMHAARVGRVGCGP